MSPLYSDLASTAQPAPTTQPPKTTISPASLASIKSDLGLTSWTSVSREARPSLVKSGLACSTGISAAAPTFDLGLTGWTSISAAIWRVSTSVPVLARGYCNGSRRHLKTQSSLVKSELGLAGSTLIFAAARSSLVKSDWGGSVPAPTLGYCTDSRRRLKDQISLMKLAGSTWISAAARPSGLDGLTSIPAAIWRLSTAVPLAARGYCTGSLKTRPSLVQSELGLAGSASIPAAIRRVSTSVPVLARGYSTDSPFSHLDARGRAQMVDVGSKPVTSRRAEAECLVQTSGRLLRLLRDSRLPKGDAISAARIAGVMAAKRTADLIPLCHTLPLDCVHIDIQLPTGDGAVRIRCSVSVTARTGAEMEALTGCSIAALTLYDMCKAVDKGIRITDLRLVSKSGGRSGDWPPLPPAPLNAPVRRYQPDPVRRTDETYAPTAIGLF